MSSNYFNKYKYNLLQNAMYKKFRILNSTKFSRIKKETQVQPNNYQYYPIETDNSKVEGHTIYLVTQDEDNYNKNNDKYEKMLTEPTNNLYKNKNNLIIDNEHLIAQRTNKFTIFREYNNTLTWRNYRNKNQVHISQNKIYDFNKAFNEINKNNIFDNNINNNRNNLDYINTIKTKQETNSEIENEEYNNSNRISAYKRKITSNPYKIKTEDNEKNNILKSKIINRFNEIQINKAKEENLDKEPFSENRIIDNEENKKEPITKNNSLNEYYNITNSRNLALLNNSLDETNQNQYLLYKSLEGNILNNFIKSYG